MSNTKNNQALVELPNLSDIVRRNAGAVTQQVQKPQVAVAESVAEEAKQLKNTPPTGKAPPKWKVPKDSSDKSSSQSSEHFTFICDNVIVEKIKAIASREGFTIRQVMELFLNHGIDAYERKHGSAIFVGKNINDLL